MSQWIKDTTGWKQTAGNGSSSGSGGTSDYSNLTNKPKINNVELSGNKSLSDLGISVVTSEKAGLAPKLQVHNEGGIHEYLSTTGDYEIVAYAKYANTCGSASSVNGSGVVVTEKVYGSGSSVKNAQAALDNLSSAITTLQSTVGTINTMLEGV